MIAPKPHPMRAQRNTVQLRRNQYGTVRAPMVASFAVLESHPIPVQTLSTVNTTRQCTTRRKAMKPGLPELHISGSKVNERASKTHDAYGTGFPGGADTARRVAGTGRTVDGQVLAFSAAHAAC